MKQKKLFLFLEALSVILIITMLGWTIIPMFLSAQNINTPENFPDPNFRAAVEIYMEVEPGGVFTAKQAAEKASTLHFQGKGITDTTGISFLKSVVIIHANDNKIQSIDQSQMPLLEALFIDNNQLTAIHAANNMKLKTLSCNNNQLKEIQLADGGNLVSLFASNNQLTTIDVSKSSKLRDLVCINNFLTELDTTQNPDLQILNVIHNQLESINVTNNKNLSDFQISNNQLTSVPDLSNNPNVGMINLNFNQLDCNSLEAIKKMKLDRADKPNFFVTYSQQNHLNLDDCENKLQK